MNRNDPPPFRAARRAAPPLSIPPRPVPHRLPPTAAQMPPTAAQAPRRPCGFCARVRKLLRIGP